MAFTTLISTDALAVRLADPTLVIVGCRFKLDGVAWGERGHLERHIYQREINVEENGLR